jgi:hypothetical protein
MTVATVVVLGHAFVAIAMVVGLGGRWIILGAASRVDDLPAMRTLTAAAGPFERMVIVSSTVTLILGLAAAWVTGRSVLGPITGGPIDWLFVSVLLYFSVLPLVPLVFLPRGRVFEAAMGEASAAGTVTPALRAAWRDPVVRAAHLYELAAISVILGLMLVKPF